MNDYTTALNAHLARYKTDRLGVSQPGPWKDSKGKTHYYDHILPEGLDFLNLLEGIRSEFQAYLADHSKIGLHRYFRHLNSSQAFAFNFFYPYFAAGSASATVVCQSLGLDLDASVDGWCFEDVQYDNTNVHFVWQTSKGTKVFCEVKLSEAEFGKAANDDEHKKKLEGTYRQRLNELVSPDLLEEATFFKHYQLLRNVSLLNQTPGSDLVILLPRANVSLMPQLARVREGLRPEFRNRFHVAYIEDAIHALESSESLPQKLRAHAVALREKYIHESPVVFDDANDRAYLTWKDEHPDYFVLTSNRSLTPRHTVIHRATCPKVSILTGNAQPGGFTRDYLKVGARTISELQAWATQKRSDAEYRECTFCSGK